MSVTNVNFWNFENIYQITLLTFCAGIFILSCYLRRKKKPKIAMTICKQQIKNGDTVFIFERYYFFNGQLLLHARNRISKRRIEVEGMQQNCPMRVLP